MDFFDDETGRRPADAEGPPSAPEPRRRPDRRRTRYQRIAVVAVVLFAVVFGIAWWARSCQHNRKVESYRTYFTGVQTAIADSTKYGKRIAVIMKDPTKLSQKELIAELDQLAAKQEEVAVRAGRLEAPDALQDEQDVFARGMRIRAQGFDYLRTAIVGALGDKEVTVKDISALDGYFSGPDAYYAALCQLPAKEIMAEQGVSGVAVPASTYFLNWTALDPATVTLALESVGKSPKLTGIHGVALIDVTASSSAGDQKLAGGVNDVPASPDLSFVVQVQNQGNVAEKNVRVVAVLTLPGGDPNTIRKEGSIASIAAGKTQSVTLSGFAIPTEALSKEIKLRVVAGPVKGERTKTNNSATYRLLLQLR